MSEEFSVKWENAETSENSKVANQRVYMRLSNVTFRFQDVRLSWCLDQLTLQDDVLRSKSDLALRKLTYYI
jgi:hypothetical protein